MAIKKKLAIIGASYLQLPLVLKARQMDLEVYCFAWEEGAVCRSYVDHFFPVSTTNLKEIRKICEEFRIDGITSIGSDVAVPTINYVAHHMGLIGNSIEDSLATTNKYYMRKRFLEHRVASPKFLEFSIDTCIDTVNELKYPIIIKPVDRSGSRGVQKVYNFENVPSAIERAQDESFIKSSIVEEYIDGIEVSVETISWQGEHYILAITDKETTGEPFFVELAHHQPSKVSQGLQQIIISETIKALNSLNIKYGASHTELKIRNDKDVFVIEVGARMGGDFIGSDLVYLSTGYDFLRGVIDVSLGHFECPQKPDNNYSGVYFLSKERFFLKEIIEKNDLDVIVRSKILNNDIRFLQCSADRSGYLIYQSNEKVNF